MENENKILTENAADIAAAQEAGYDKALVSRLALTPKKVSGHFCYHFHLDKLKILVFKGSVFDYLLNK